jgi:hypothetical protein
MEGVLQLATSSQTNAASSPASTRRAGWRVSARRAPVLALGALLLSIAVCSFAPAAAGAERPFARARGGVVARERLAARALLAPRSRRPEAAGELGSRGVSPSLKGAPNTITGKVTSSDSKMPIAGIEVCAMAREPAVKSGEEEEAEPPFHVCVFTPPSGEYTIAGLPPGEYEVQFAAPLFAGPALNFARVFYDGAAGSEKSAAAVVLRLHNGQTAAGIDARMKDGAEIAGTVTNGTGEALAAIEVCGTGQGAGEPEAVEGQGAFLQCALSDAGGNYVAVGLPHDEYEIRFAVPPEGLANYAPQYWHDASTPNSAELLKVKAGETAASIDAQLAIGGEIIGTTTDASTGLPLGEAEICTAFIEGEAGAEPAEQEEEANFERCTTSAADGSYALAALASGSYEVEFLGFGYLSQIYRDAATKNTATRVPVLAGAATTGIDAALVPEVPPPPPRVPAPAPVPPPNVQQPTVLAPSSAQLRSLLATLIVPRGASSRLGALLRRGQYLLATGTLPAGQLSVAWYATPAGGGRSAAHRQFLIAAGTLALTTPETRLAIRLTRAGKRLLRDVRQLKVNAKATFRPTGLPAVSDAHSFTLHR